MDVSAFRVRRERLRRFCFRQTRAAIVIRDCSISPKLPNDPVSRLAEVLQILLTVDPTRFADPDDTCGDAAPSIFAFPTSDSRSDVEVILKACNSGSEPIVVDFRLNELVLPIIAPHLACDIAQSTRVWDRAMRRQKRLCAIVTRDERTDDFAIRCDGGAVLRHADGKTFDLGDHFWRQVYREVATQRCMRRDAWQRSAFPTAGTA